MNVDQLMKENESLKEDNKRLKERADNQERKLDSIIRGTNRESMTMPGQPLSKNDGLSAAANRSMQSVGAGSDGASELPTRFDEDAPAANLADTSKPFNPNELQQPQKPYAGNLGDEGDGKEIQKQHEEYVESKNEAVESFNRAEATVRREALSQPTRQASRRPSENTPATPRTTQEDDAEIAKRQQDELANKISESMNK